MAAISKRFSFFTTTSPPDRSLQGPPALRWMVD
jgi:hypothetical protein